MQGGYQLVPPSDRMISSNGLAADLPPGRSL